MGPISLDSAAAFKVDLDYFVHPDGHDNPSPSASEGLDSYLSSPGAAASGDGVLVTAGKGKVPSGRSVISPKYVKEMIRGIALVQREQQVDKKFLENLKNLTPLLTSIISEQRNGDSTMHNFEIQLRVISQMYSVLKLKNLQKQFGEVMGSGTNDGLVQIFKELNELAPKLNSLELMTEAEKLYRELASKLERISDLKSFEIFPVSEARVGFYLELSTFIRKEVESWAIDKDAKPGTDRRKAVDLILDNWAHLGSRLDLSNLNLDSVPDCLKLFGHLEELQLPPNLKGNAASILAYIKDSEK